MTLRIATAIRKGGAGKTSVTVNVAAAAAMARGLRTLVLDFDSQCNATHSLLGPSLQPRTVKDVVEGTCALSEAMVQAHHENLWMVAGDPDLDEMVRFADDRQFDLAVLGIRNLLYRTLPEEIDLVLIDTPPGDVFWARVALASVDYYLCVAWPDDYSAQGLLKLGHAVDAVKSQFNPGLQMAGLVINYVRRTKGADSYVRAYRSIFGDAVLDPILPLRTNIPDAAAAYMPVEVYERNGRVKADTTPIFHALTDALLERVGYVATKAGDRT